MGDSSVEPVTEAQEGKLERFTLKCIRKSLVFLYEYRVLVATVFLKTLKLQQLP